VKKAFFPALGLKLYFFASPQKIVLAYFQPTFKRFEKQSSS